VIWFTQGTALVRPNHALSNFFQRAAKQYLRSKFFVGVTLMKLILAIASITAGIVATAVFAASPEASAPKGARVPVLLELFTSEGCSDCPPADRILASLDQQPVGGAELIVLGEHVDYWDYQGWADPYSSPVYSDREKRYSQLLGANVYTPQLVVDGRVQIVGGNRPEIMSAIRRAVQEPKLPLSISAVRSGNEATVHVEANGGGRNADLYIALAMDRGESHVMRGENRGRTLDHVAIARAVLKIGKWEGAHPATRDLSISAKQFPASLATAQPGDIRVVAFLQDPKTGRVLRAAQARM
jgi:hypothetical protein